MSLLFQRPHPAKGTIWACFVVASGISRHFSLAATVSVNIVYISIFIYLVHESNHHIATYKIIASGCTKQYIYKQSGLENSSFFLSFFLSIHPRRPDLSLGWTSLRSMTGTNWATLAEQKHAPWMSQIECHLITWLKMQWIKMNR